MSEFGNKISEIRTSAKVTLSSLSKYLGISPSRLSDVEHGRRPPFRALVIEKFAEYFSTSLSELNKLAAKERSSIEIRLNEANDSVNQFAFNFSRRVEKNDLNEETLKRLLKILDDE